MAKRFCILYTLDYTYTACATYRAVSKARCSITAYGFTIPALIVLGQVVTGHYYILTTEPLITNPTKMLEYSSYTSPASMAYFFTCIHIIISVNTHIIIIACEIHITPIVS